MEFEHLLFKREAEEKSEVRRERGARAPGLSALEIARVFTRARIC